MTHKQDDTNNSLWDKGVGAKCSSKSLFIFYSILVRDSVGIVPVLAPNYFLFGHMGGELAPEAVDTKANNVCKQ